jgi:hypothetical protein
MRKIVASESKTKFRLIFAAGVFGFVVGMAGALMLDQFVLTNDFGPVGALKQDTAVRHDSIGPVATAYQAKSRGGDGRVVEDARHDKPASGRAISRLHVKADDINLRAGPATTTSPIAKLKRGTDLVQIQRAPNWIQVEIPSMEGKRGWIHQSLVDHGPFEATPKKTVARAVETPRSAEVALGLASDGTCQRALTGDNSSINCMQRGDDNGAPDKTLDIFQDLIKLKKHACDGRIDAASYVKRKNNQIFLVQCGDSTRYVVEVFGDDLKVRPAKVESAHQKLNN